MELSSLNNIAIVGGGPAGVFCALQLGLAFKKNSFFDYSITIFDKSQILRTILPTGNGRCNITNFEPEIREFVKNYPRGEKFLYSIFSKYFNYDAIDYFNSIGIETYVQDDLRVFPKSNSAADVKNKLLNELKKYPKIKIINREIKSNADLKEFSKIVIATGTKSDVKFIKEYNHNLIPFKKALCGLKIKNNIYPKGVSVKSLDGDFIFTDFGVSGPLIFKLSSLNILKKFPYELTINLFDPDELINLVKSNPKKSIGNLVSRFIPKSLAKVIVRNYDRNAAEISNLELVSYSKLNLEIISTVDQGEIVNSGGVDLKELTSDCKSKLYDNLWFCGEIMDIDGFCGGFNLQNCWSSAYVVANDIVRSIIK